MKEPIEPSYDNIVDEVLTEMFGEKFGKGMGRMERNSEIEKTFIKSIAQKVHDKAFILSALNMMNTDEKRKK